MTFNLNLINPAIFISLYPYSLRYNYLRCVTGWAGGAVKFIPPCWAWALRAQAQQAKIWRPDVGDAL